MLRSPDGASTRPPRARSASSVPALRRGYTRHAHAVAGSVARVTPVPFSIASRTPDDELLGYDDALAGELRGRLWVAGYASGDLQRDL